MSGALSKTAQAMEVLQELLQAAHRPEGAHRTGRKSHAKQTSFGRFSFISFIHPKYVYDGGCAAATPRVTSMNTMNPHELLASSSFSADEALVHVQRLYARLQLLPGTVGMKQHSAAYTALEAEIRVWADRYSKISGD